MHLGGLLSDAQTAERWGLVEGAPCYSSRHLLLAISMPGSTGCIQPSAADAGAGDESIKSVQAAWDSLIQPPATGAGDLLSVSALWPIMEALKGSFTYAYTYMSQWLLYIRY